MRVRVHSEYLPSVRRRGGERETEGGTRALGSGTWTHLDDSGTRHGQAGVSDLDLGGRRAAVIGGLGFGAVVRAWALLCSAPGAAPSWCSSKLVLASRFSPAVP